MKRRKLLVLVIALALPFLAAQADNSGAVQTAAAANSSSAVLPIQNEVAANLSSKHAKQDAHKNTGKHHAKKKSGTHGGGSKVKGKNGMLGHHYCPSCDT